MMRVQSHHSKSSFHFTSFHIIHLVVFFVTSLTWSRAKATT